MAVLAYRPGAVPWIVALQPAARLCGPAFADSTPLCGAHANSPPPPSPSPRTRSPPTPPTAETTTTTPTT